METEVLIIGGGVTGTGLARDLGLRGIKTILVEKEDINAGASGGNHGLLHSGARYISNDVESAKECMKEGKILKKTAPFCIDNCGGLFVAVQGDVEKYAADFPLFCEKSGINCKPISPEQAIGMEPALSKKVIAVYRVEDGAIDPFMLSLENIAQAKSLGSSLLCHTKVVSMERDKKRITRVWLKNLRTGKKFSIEPQQVVNASGAWAGHVAALAGAKINILFSMGTLLVTQSRITNGVVNRLRPPSNADILVPGGTVSILGTTSERIDDPDRIRPTVKETDLIVKQGAQINVIKTDLTIIGSGMAGMAATVFAVNRGIATTLTGRSSSIHFASGLMDLMGVYPPGVQNIDPWSAIELIRKDIVNHPYSKISNKDISTALVEIITFLKDQGLFYQRAAYRNIDVVTSVGTLKKTHMMPQTMWNGVIAFETKAPALLVDFTGLKIFSAKQMEASFRSQWPGIKSICIDFPDTEHLEEVLPEHLSRSLDLSENRIKLAERIKPFVKEVKYVGFPAMLGMYKSKEAVEEMEKLLGVPVFEIPTPPVSVPGIRLQESLKKGLEKNVCLHSLPEVVKDVEFLSNGSFILSAGKENALKRIESKGLILETGRFLGKGLTADRTGIRENLLNLPVTQPEKREMWHNEDLFHLHGHEINRAGIETDDMFRPLTESSKPFSNNLFAAGSILAHSDWTRMKCGSGVAIATAFATVKAFNSSKNL